MKTQIAALLFLALAATGCEKELNVNEEGNLVPKTVELDKSLPAISVNGTLLHAESFGNPSDPMLIVLHGGPGDDYRSLLNCKAFADSGFYVVFYDQRGCGLSKREGLGNYAMNTMPDDLGAVIAHYRTSADQKVFLLGHSWGGILASIYVNEHPQAIDGLILCEPGGLIWDDIMDYVGRARSFGFGGETLNDATYIDQFLTGGDDQHALLDYKHAMHASTEGEPGSPMGDEGKLPFWRYGAVVNRALFELGEKENPNWSTNLHAYEHPVLFCYSENNTAYGPDWAQHVSAPYANVQLHRIEDAGHYMFSFPRGFNQFFPLAIQYLRSLQ